ncbi:hypothetical protein Q7P37_001385 [Cladosporium fusiforme]
MLACAKASLRLGFAAIKLPHPPDFRSAVSVVSIPRASTPSPRRLHPLRAMSALPTSSFSAPAGNVGVEEPWYAAYPEARSTPTPISRAELLHLLKSSVKATDLVLVDLRRTDFVGGTIKGSINLPAQSLYQTIPALYNIFHAAGARRIVWYCGSSRGRGNRAAAWFADYIVDKADRDMQSLVLEGGIKGWVNEKGEYLQHMQHFDESQW